jgi:hypothetical protein
MSTPRPTEWSAFGDFSKPRGADGGRTLTDEELAAARLAEAAAGSPGRLARRLLAEIDSYLEFFAIAHGTA